jgi:hypothetical protein
MGGKHWARRGTLPWHYVLFAVAAFAVKESKDLAEEVTSFLGRLEYFAQEIDEYLHEYRCGKSANASDGIGPRVSFFYHVFMGGQPSAGIHQKARTVEFAIIHL